MRIFTLSSIVLALAGLAACGDESTPNVADSGVADSATDMAAPLPDADDHGGLLLPECDDTEPAGTMNLMPVPSTLVGTISTEFQRMTPGGPLNPAAENGEAMYASLGYANYSRGPGQEIVRRDQLTGRSGTPGPAPTERYSIGWFAHLSDFQLVDDESPTRLASFDTTIAPGALRAQEAYLARAMSAMNRTAAELTAEPHRPFDFGIITGDCTDSAQKNELEWMIDVMNGTPGVHTDSGDDDDPIPGPDNDPKDPFDPVAFPAPWLFVPGNHDVLAVGVTPINAMVASQLLGSNALTGTRDYKRWYAPVRRGTNITVADPRREGLDREDIVAMLRADEDGPGPVGHGYGENTDFTLGAHYAYDAIPGLLRVISIDTSDLTGGSEGMVTERQMNEFIIPAIEDAEEEGLLVMLASHHSTTNIDQLAGQAGDPIAGTLTPAEIEAEIASHANVIAWLVGHSHNNRIRAVAGPDAEHPGYWEIMTAAIADWPSQIRTIELVDNGDGTLSIYGVIVDWNEENCMERRMRRLTLMEWTSGWFDPISLAPEDHNVELIVPLSASALETVEGLRATASERIESETTLRGL